MPTSENELHLSCPHCRRDLWQMRSDTGEPMEQFQCHGCNWMGSLSTLADLATMRLDIMEAGR